jgi:hypothetical protein
MAWALLLPFSELVAGSCLAARHDFARARGTEVIVALAERKKKFESIPALVSSFLLSA